MDGADLVVDIVDILGSGIVEYAKKFGAGLNQCVMSIFCEEVTGTGGAITYELSNTGKIIIVFAALSLAIGLTRWVVQFVTSLGQRNK